MRYVLGLSALYHDSAAALLRDGEIVAAAQEERFTRVRHDERMPTQSIAYCLREAGIAPGDVDLLCFYEKPLRHFDRLLETYFAYAPRGFASFRHAMPVWLADKLWLRRRLRAALDGAYRSRVVFTDHHESHAASAFFPSPFERAAIITCDGVGEWATTTWGVGEGNRIRIERAISFPHSLGLLYSAFTYFAGFKVNSGEYKLMGLAPYGEPRFAEIIRRELIDVKPDGSYRLDMRYFTYCESLRMTGARFAALFGGPPRDPESPITQREMDLAASIQAVTEDVMLRMAHHVHAQTGAKDLCLAGGVALNCVANGRIVREGPFERVWVQPAAGDAGGALGSALFAWHQLLDRPRRVGAGDSQRGSLLGPQFQGGEVARMVRERGAVAVRYDDESALVERVATLLAAKQVVGWFHGRMEFGPRALGCRSIIADPRAPETQSVLNLKIKFRESFRPFAPCVLRERAHEVFEMAEGLESPYMLLVAPVREALRNALSDDDRARMREPDLRTRVNVARSSLPAITHVDYSARVQTVDEARHGRFYRLMKAFEKQTGCPVVVNTSFNVRGEPIVHTPSEALDCFLHTGMDVLVLEDHVLLKTDQPPLLLPGDTRAHLARFALD